jgi:hypothetical protein
MGFLVCPAEGDALRRTGTDSCRQSSRRSDQSPAGNIYLDSFDQFMKSRGHRIVRYADDIVTFKASKSGAENALRIASEYLENQLKLTVNQKKTQITSLSHGLSYLGVVIYPGYTRIQPKRLRRFKEKVRACTRRNTPVNLRKILDDLNPLLRGFANYFKVANCQVQMTCLNV